MRVLLSAVLLLQLGLSAQAINKAELDNRIRLLTYKFEELQSKPDKRIPADVLKKAQGIILLDRTKAGFIFAYQGGAGLAMVKDPKSGAWSAPAFLKANEASLGFQIGGQQTFVVVLLMNTNATRGLTQSSFDFGGEASGTAGNSSSKVEGTLSEDYKPLMLVYTDTAGLYGGAAIKGGAVSPDPEANFAFYGEYITPNDIFFAHKGQPDEAVTALVQKITENSK